MEEICMSRPSAATQWGFRLQGGVDFCQRLSILRVEPNSLAAGASLRVGDCVVEINGTKTEGLTHHSSLNIIRQGGDHLRLNIIRERVLIDKSNGYCEAQISRPSQLPVSRDYQDNRYRSSNQSYSPGSSAVRESSYIEHQPAVSSPTYRPSFTATSPARIEHRSPLATHTRQQVVYSPTTTKVTYSPMSQRPREGSETLNGFNIPSREQVLSEQLSGTHITVKQGTQFSTEFNSQSPTHSQSPVDGQQYNHNQYYSQNSCPTWDTKMSSNQHSPQNEQIPDRLLTQFNSKRPEDKPFSYLPTGGIAELQQRSSASVRQREAAPPVRPKPLSVNRQTSYGSPQLDTNGNNPKTYDPASLFTPAYKEMVQNQQDMLSRPSPTALPADMVGFGPGKIPQEDVAAYILQPDGTMAALRPNQQTSRWNDRPGPDLQNSAVMAALVEEQNAQMHGSTSGRIHSVQGGASKQGLSFKVLQWLTGTDSEDGSETMSNYSGSHDGHQMTSPAHRRMRQHSFESQQSPPRRIEEETAADGRPPRRNSLKIVSRGNSVDKSVAPQRSGHHNSKIQQLPEEDVAYCDF